MEIEQKKTFLINVAFTAVVISLIYLFTRFLLSYLLPFVIALILAFAMQKPSAVISEKTGIKRSTCSVLLVTLSYFAVIGIIALLFWLVYSNAADLTKRTAEFVSHLSSSVQKVYMSFKSRMSGKSADAVEKFFSKSVAVFTSKLSEIISQSATRTVKAVPSFFISSIVTAVAGFYIAKDYQKLGRFIYGLMSPKFKKVFTEIKRIVTKDILKLVGGYSVLTLITFVLLSIGFMILRIKPALGLAAVVAIIDILPVLGTGTVLLPWAVISFINGKIFFGVGITLLYVVISLSHNFFEPHIIGKKLGINPLFILIAIFLGFRVAGVAGMLLVPLSMIVTVDFFTARLSKADKGA